MSRVLGVVSAAIVVSQWACLGALAAPGSESHHGRELHARIDGTSALVHPVTYEVRTAAHRPVRARHVRRRHAGVISPANPPADDLTADSSNGAEPMREVAARPPELPERPYASQVIAEIPEWILTQQERQVRDIAIQSGDADFLMVDKPAGRFVLFQNGRPTFIGPALTGQSNADILPPGATSEEFAQLVALEDKVTPAGRFSVWPGYDRNYGPILDVKELKGKDWGIAVHQVYLGTPSEHRAERIRSPDQNAHHITFGCINVTPEAIRVLTRELPKDRPTPLYVLPQDTSRTSAYFMQRNS